MPNVSVIIPTYNRAKLIERSIRSVLKQTYGNFELIIVDDGSTDNTRDVVRLIDDERISYIGYKINKGSPHARNTGIKAATGELIAFHDCDDIWLPTKLEKQISAFDSLTPQVGVVYTSLYRHRDNRRILIPTPDTKKTEGDIHYELLRGNFVTTASAVVRKECFEKVGMFDEELPRMQDWDLWIRISKYYHFKHINEVLLISWHYSDSISGRGKNHAEVQEVILRKYFDDIVLDRKTLAWHYFTIGKLACFEENFVKGRNYLKKAAFTEPYNIKYLFAAISSIGGKNLFRFALKLRKNLG